MEAASASDTEPTGILLTTTVALACTLSALAVTVVVPRRIARRSPESEIAAIVVSELFQPTGTPLITLPDGSRKVALRWVFAPITSVARDGETTTWLTPPPVGGTGMGPLGV